MFKRFFTLFCSIIISCIALAQDFNNYTPIKSSGQIPEKFTTSSTEKYRKDADRISRKESSRSRNAKNQFYLESNFAIDELLLSGKVLFNDEASLYVGRVMDELLKDDKALRDKIEVYVVKNSAVNAFTTNNGIVFVCMGLLAQLKNEAQLAYVLSHEIIHFREQHVLKGYVENTDIQTGSGKYKQQSYDERLLSRSNFSKEQETEADKEGFLLFSKSKYNYAALNGVFDILAFSHLPFSQLPFRKDFLQTGDLVLPSIYFLKETNPVKAAEEDDSLGSHPGVKLRREVLMQLVKEKDSNSRKNYIVSQQEFNKVQKISRFEIADAQLQEREYENALYSAYILLQENPESIYLQKILLGALYGLSKYANAHDLNEVHVPYEEIEGSSQQVFYLFEKLSRSQLNIVALDYAWNLAKKYPADEEIKDIQNDLFAELTIYHYKSVDVFSTTLPRPEDTVAINRKMPDNSDSNAVKTIVFDINEHEEMGHRVIPDKDGEIPANIERDDFSKYAFVNELKDTAFTGLFSKFSKLAEETEKQEKQMHKRKYRNMQAAKDAENQRNGYAMGLDKVVFVSPFYYKYNRLKRESYRKLSSEESQRNLSAQLEKSATLAQLPYTMLDKKNLGKEDVEKFNDMVLLNDYLDITFSHNGIKFMNHKKEELRALGKKYNTRYFCWSGVSSVRQYRPMKIFSCMSLGCYPLIPLSVYYLFKRSYTTTLYTLVLDTETGENILINTNSFRKADTQDMINSSLYDLCLQLKRAE